jgi:NADH-quinone oxidoreductase subunit J
MTPIQIIFLLVAAVTLASAVLVVSTRRIMHAAMWLILALLGVAILFATLETRFFVVVQIIVYIGAIAILIIFAVMLTRHVMDDSGAQLNRNWWIAALIALLLFVGLVAALSTWSGFETDTRTVQEGGEDLVAFGKALVDPNGFMIPFEVASVLLLAALIGAVYIAQERRGGRG